MSESKRDRTAAAAGKASTSSGSDGGAALRVAAAGEGRSSSPEGEEHERLILRIHGRVQGVGYRATAVEKALEIGVTGWVRNLENGVVELQAEGTPEKLDRLLLWCRRGPRMARVHEVDIWRQAATGEFQGFRVR
jgi:acylphosphatase